MTMRYVTAIALFVISIMALGAEILINVLKGLP